MNSQLTKTRTALVTGAGSPAGIGFATAQALGVLGYRIGITSTTERIWDRVRELEALGIETFGFIADLTVEEQANKLVGEFIARFNTLDVLVNNAGMRSITTSFETEHGALESYSTKSWHKTIARNMDTTMLVTKAAMPFIKLSSAGRVINVASTTGPVVVIRENVGYATAKSALIGFTRAVALDYAHFPLTVNSVAPGWIATSIEPDDETLQGEAAPMKRSGTPEEVASAIVWLASVGASYITGQCIVIDGGNSLPEERA